MRVRFTPRAQGDVIEIYDYIAKRSPISAQRVEDAISLACGGLKDFPEIGVATDRKNIRRLPLVAYPYTIYYRVNWSSDTVEILRVIRGSRIKNLSKVPAT